MAAGLLARHSLATPMGLTPGEQLDAAEAEIRRDFELLKDCAYSASFKSEEFTVAHRESPNDPFKIKLLPTPLVTTGTLDFVSHSSRQRVRLFPTGVAKGHEGRDISQQATFYGSQEGVTHVMDQGRRATFFAARRFDHAVPMSAFVLCPNSFCSQFLVNPSWMALPSGILQHPKYAHLKTRLPSRRSVTAEAITPAITPEGADVFLLYELKVPELMQGSEPFRNASWMVYAPDMGFRPRQVVCEQGLGLLRKFDIEWGQLRTAEFGKLWFPTQVIMSEFDPSPSGVKSERVLARRFTLEIAPHSIKVGPEVRSDELVIHLAEGAKVTRALTGEGELPRMVFDGTSTDTGGAAPGALAPRGVSPLRRPVFIGVIGLIVLFLGIELLRRKRIAQR